MRKYINFADEPFFMPNYNPKEMIEMGIFKGLYSISPDDDITRMTKAEPITHRSFPPDNNYYRVEPKEEHDSPGYPLSGDAARREFFQWYAYFYYGVRKVGKHDQKWITKWIHSAYFLYDNHIKVDDFTKEPSPEHKQLLLELGLNWKFYPNNQMNKEWILQRFPLKP